MAIEAVGSLPAAASTPLSELINNATRHQHTTINRLISSRLPLCLPPHASQPDAYLVGITQIAEIFIAFESLWDEITSTSQLPSLENTWDSLETYPHPLAAAQNSDDAFIAALRALRPMGMARSSRLKNDLEYLRCVCGIAEDDARCSVAEGIRAHVETQVRSKPHLLIAYAWTLYLAVFSGGRHIRNLLCEAGEEFWLGRATASGVQVKPAATEKKSGWNWRSPVARLTSSSSKADTESKPKSRRPKTVDELGSFEAKGLSLWFFPGPNDGNELRVEFKQRLHELEPLLSVEQELEIVAEAQAIFSRIEALVAELDVAITADSAAKASPLEDGQTKENDSGDSVAVFPLDILPTKQAATDITPVPILKESSIDPQQRWVEIPNYAGLALVICGISYGAMYYAGRWAA